MATFRVNKVSVEYNVEFEIKDVATREEALNLIKEFYYNNLWLNSNIRICEYMPQNLIEGWENKVTVRVEVITQEQSGDPYGTDYKGHRSEFRIINKDGNVEEPDRYMPVCIGG